MGKPICLPRTGLYCRAKLSVVNADGSIAYESPWHKNMITNYGLNTNGIVSHILADCMKYAVLGVGGITTEYDSAADTAQQALTTVTFNVSDANAAAGRWIVWDSGEEARLVANVSPNVWTVDRSQVVVSGFYTIYYTEMTALTTEVKRSGACQVAAAGCGYATGNDGTGHYMKLWRTWDFTAEVGAVTYNELAISWHSTAGNLWSIVNLGGGYALLATQQARVRYELFCYVEPDTLTAQTAALPEWGNPAGDDIITDYANNISVVDPVNGNTQGIASGIDDMSAATVWVGDDATAPAFGAATPMGTSTTKAATPAAYVDDNFYREYEAIYTVSEANQTVRKIGLLSVGNFYCLCFDSNQTKANTHNLRLKFRKSWARIWI